ncbi:MAG TPA: polyhydroxyalkanoate depolymerase [Caulobacteraceae bacterium]|nr:polyhydroxyalkanoate depolymerase [Caulobacteraceae bacterium]
MLYALHEAAYGSAAPLRLASEWARAFWTSPMNPAAATSFGRAFAAQAEMTAHFAGKYVRPPWRIEEALVDGRPVPVTSEVVLATPWLKLRSFRRDLAPAADAPTVLLVAPLSGHHSTLLRGTVRAFLKDFDVCVTEWANARDVPLFEGRFGFYDYAEAVEAALAALGGRAHVVAVCQPGPAVMAAAARAAEARSDNRPASLVLMGSPIDARLSPTVPTRLAQERPFTWFASNMIYTVPPPYPGVLRRVYPGFIQLASFISMNVEAHQEAHRRWFEHLVAGDGDSADKHRAFYEEYLSVLDLTEEFYLETVDIVFQRHLLARGELSLRGARVDLAALTDTGLMTVEGDGDDISGVGQTQAAHGLCPNIPDGLRALHVQEGVGHYGVFNGRRFGAEIYPRIRDFIGRCQAALSEG